MKQIIILCAILAGSLAFAGCNERIVESKPADQQTQSEQTQEAESKPVKTDTDPLFIKSMNGFGLNSSTAVFSTKGLEQNIVYSPIALGYTLGSITEATTGGIQTQLINTLNLGNMAAEKRIKQFQQAHQNNTFDLTQGKVIIENSMWTEPDTVKPEIQETLQSCFFTEIHPVDFTDPTSFEAMSSWFRENSNGTLTPQFKNNPKERKMFLNTAYVESPWQTTVDVLESDTFYGTAGESMCKYLSTMLYNSHYQEGTGYVQANIPLTNGVNLSFVMPIPGYSLEQLLQSPAAMNEIFQNSNAEISDISLKFPAFSVTSTINFKNAINALGIFNLYPAGEEWIGFNNPHVPITSIIQQVTLNVDENGCNSKSSGSEPADTASDQSSAISAPRQVELTIDRPFLFIVRSSEGLPILTGIINDIA